MLVQQILAVKGGTDVITVTPETKVQEACRILAERRIGGLVVSADGTTADGILSERDIVRALALRGASCLKERVDAMMTRNPVCCGLHDTSDAVLSQMTEGRFRHLPVIEAGRLVGIVTIGDVVKARLEDLSMERNALEGMIMGY